MADRLTPFPGCLIGSWRGVQMHVPDVSSPAGRRIVSIDLPGTDVTLHEDLGLYTGPIRVTGLLAGDDVVDQARAMQAACEQPGPGTLVHPWLGEMLVVLKDPAEIRFRSDALRTVQVSLSFERWSGGPAVGPTTLAAIGAAVGLVDGLVGDLLALAVDGLPSIDDVVGGLLDDVIADVAGSIAGGALTTAIAESGLSLLVDGIADASGLSGWVSDLVGTIGAAGVPPASPAIGVGPLGRAAEAAIEPWSAVAALLGVAETQAEASRAAGGEGESLVRVSTAIAAITAATAPLAAVDWESRQQALAARALVSAAAASVSDAVIGSTTASASTSSVRRGAWRALASLRRAIHQDLDDVIGRLPSVMTVTPPTRVSAWVIAHHLFGDDPNAVRSGFEDIVKRNRLSHPSIVDVDPIEVLPR